jgi:hypothetical protein
MTRMNSDQRDAAYAMLLWIDNQWTSVHQALVMAAEHNERDAAMCEAGDQEAVAQVLRQSGMAWRRHADELTKLAEALPQDLADLGL